MSDHTESLQDALFKVLESGAAEHQAHNGDNEAADEFALFVAQHLNHDST